MSGVSMEASALTPANIRVTVFTKNGDECFTFGRADLQDTIAHRFDQFVQWIQVTRSRVVSSAS